MKSFSTQRGIVCIVPLLVLSVIAGMVIWFFLNKGGLGTKGTIVPIFPSQLMPFVSAQEARKIICDLKKDGLFVEVCQSKFDVVSKEDIEKITELFALLDKIKNDKHISDYDRLLLSQAIFAALPVGDNPESSIYQPSLLSRLRDYLTSQITIYAQEKTMSDKEFKELMKKDLQNMVDSLPKEDNAWVINVMVSKYSWVDGKFQPLYSHQYAESFDPFPNNLSVNRQDINYNVQSVSGSKTSGQTVDVGRPSYKGTSDMIAYSFTIMSWDSQKYTSSDEPVEEKFLVKKRNFSDSSYQGEHHLATLLDSVKLPSTKRPIESPDERESKDVSQINTPEKLTCEEWKDIYKANTNSPEGIGSPKCPHPAWESFKGGNVWCAASREEFLSTVDERGSLIYKDINDPKYTFDFDYDECMKDLK